MRLRPVDISAVARAGASHLPFVERHLIAAAALLDRAPAAISVVLVGDAEMSRLHARYLADPTPTDVLTFELDHDGGGNVTEGEVVVCVPEAVRRAGRGTDAVERELLLYALHGLLHLSGFDDTTADAHARMHAAEDDLLTRIGVGPVFRPATSTDAPDPPHPPPAPVP